MKRGLLVLVCVSVLILMLFDSSRSFGAASDAKILKIGLITSITGPLAPALKAMADAAGPAGELMNQRGGITIKGQKYLIKVIAEDDRSSPPGGVTAVNKLMQEGVRFVIAPQFMPTNMALTPITEEAKVLRMKAMGWGKEEMYPGLTYSFYAHANMFSVPVCYDFLMRNYPKAKRVAIITPDDPGGKSLREATEKEIEKRGLKIVFQEAFKIGSEDFYPILTKALEKKPDAIDMVVSIPLWSAAIINQSRELGFGGPIFAPMMGDTHILKSMLSPKYAHDVFHGGPDVLSPNMTPLVKDFRVLVEQQLNTPLNVDHTLALEALYPLLQGIEKAQSFDTDKVVAALENMKSIDTIYGRGSMTGQEVFGINHVVRRPIPFSRIMNGTIEFEFVNR